MGAMDGSKNESNSVTQNVIAEETSDDASPRELQKDSSKETLENENEFKLEANFGMKEEQCLNNDTLQMKLQEYKAPSTESEEDEEKLKPFKPTPRRRIQSYKILDKNNDSMTSPELESFDEIVTITKTANGMKL